MIKQTVNECLNFLHSTYNVVAEIKADAYLDKSIDLYLLIKQFYKKTFDPADQIVFVIQQDTYDLVPCGLLLQNIQTMLNEIDISNNFVSIVTTNPGIKDEYHWALQNISTDPVSCNIYDCYGPWQKIPYITDYKVFTKQVAHSTKFDSIDLLTQEKKDLISKNKSFCLMAWAGIMVDTTGEVKPCCVFKESLGDSTCASIDEIRNSAAWRSLKKEMLNGQVIESCQACYDVEKLGRESVRTSANRQLAHVLLSGPDVTETNTLSDLSYWDIRHNNLCNLVCRSCSPKSSTSWSRVAADTGALTNSKPLLRISRSITEQLLPHVESVKTIYIAGGEPLIIDEFYQLLDTLIAKNRTDVELTYNTNLTKLSVGNKFITTYWKQFSNLSVGASLDGEYERGEYIRQNTNWDDIVANRKTLMSECPHIDFYVASTVSILNVLHLPDFHRSWVDQGLIKAEEFNYQLLRWPSYLRIDCAPIDIKDLVKEKYSAYLDWLRPRDTLGRATTGAESVLKYISQHGVFNAKEFWRHTDQLDNYFNKNLIDTFPELRSLPRN